MEPYVAALIGVPLRHRVPTIFQTRTSVVAGGLMSYAGSQ
jgi:hypothetical protein